MNESVKRINGQDLGKKNMEEMEKQAIILSHL